MSNRGSIIMARKVKLSANKKVLILLRCLKGEISTGGAAKEDG